MLKINIKNQHTEKYTAT